MRSATSSSVRRITTLVSARSSRGLTQEFGVELRRRADELLVQLAPQGLGGLRVEVRGHAARRQVPAHDARERQRDLRPVPARRAPLPARRVHRRNEHRARALGHQHQPRLELAPRPARPVDEVAHHHRLAQHAHHFQKSACAAARRGAANHAPAQALGDTRHALSVAALADHDVAVALPAVTAGNEEQLMPPVDDRGALRRQRLRDLVLALVHVAQRRAERAHGPGHDDGDRSLDETSALFRRLHGGGPPQARVSCRAMDEMARLEIDGKTYELPIVTGTEGERAIDIGKLRDQSGVITLDPGYKNTGSCKSAITFIDGEQGILRYRGYPIEELAEKSDFLEVAYLLIHGDLPTAEAYRV